MGSRQGYSTKPENCRAGHQHYNKAMVIHGSPENKDWITKQTEKLKPLTRYYCQKLSVQKRRILKFKDFLHPADFKNESKNDCRLFVPSIL
jgi:hypothetical protein